MSVIDDFIAIAKQEIGYEESGVNITKYNEWADNHSVWFTRVQGLSWCTTFVAWCICELKPDFLWEPSIFCLDDKCCWSDHWMNNFKKAKRFYNLPNVGDFAFRNGHIGIVSSVNSKGTFCVIEGNIGDLVVERIYSVSQWIGFGRPDWEKMEKLPLKESETTSAKEFVINHGIYIGRDDGEMHWEDNLTREEMALILYRYWKKFNK